MLTLSDGRKELYQWDTDRKLIVDGECSQVHFSNKLLGSSVDIDVVDGVVKIPDELLQTNRDLNVWAYVGNAESGYTKAFRVFKVIRRPKPADYVYTPSEIQSLKALAERVKLLEESGGLTDEKLEEIINKWLEKNPIGGGTVESVNGIRPDENGNVEIEVGDDINIEDYLDAETIYKLLEGYIKEADVDTIGDYIVGNNIVPHGRGLATYSQVTNEVGLAEQRAKDHANSLMGDLLDAPPWMTYNVEDLYNLFNETCAEKGTYFASFDELSDLVEGLCDAEVIHRDKIETLENSLGGINSILATLTDVEANANE